MREEILFRMKSPKRDDFKIRGFYFGSGKKSVAIVGPIRGDEIQQQYICSQVVKALREMENGIGGSIADDCEILVVPSVNHFSMNLERRFWAMDNTDINRMFPGYDQGETTQCIAAALFENVKGYEYGIQLASYYMKGNFIPHVRMMRTGYEDVENAKLFANPYVYLHDVKPYDTTILNYNWQLWGTKAFSLYSGNTNTLNFKNADEAVWSILRFLSKIGAIKAKIHHAYYSTVITDEDLEVVHSNTAGIFCQKTAPSEYVKKGDTLAEILDPYTGEKISTITAPCDGIIFFSYNKPLVLEKSQLYKIIR
ncbi:MAG: M14 family metallopeptidase [Opitutales bacterium]